MNITQKQKIIQEMINNLNRKNLNTEDLLDIINNFEDCGIDLRLCDICSKVFQFGYIFDAGQKHYCSDECLCEDFTKEEWLEIATDDSDNYYTEFN